ncbi:unnamed protein product [Schistocephalus solidus]|uniref:Rad21_Rec8 domain-containing protein n=1 Tax=Schistocephalus solidus TaxID=70667 RepID=A0A183TQ73_SCHSO|nr:unnamed protein product [Schistocephalus solidus]
MQTVDGDAVTRPDVNCVQSPHGSEQVRTEHDRELCSPGISDHREKASVIGREPNRVAKQATFTVVGDGEDIRASKNSSVRTETTEGDSDLELILEATRSANMAYELDLHILISLDAEGLHKGVIMGGAGKTASPQWGTPVDDQSSSSAGLEDSGICRRFRKPISSEREAGPEHKIPNLSTALGIQRLKLRLNTPKLANKNEPKGITAFLDLSFGTLMGKENQTVVFRMKDGKVLKNEQLQQRGTETSKETELKPNGNADAHGGVKDYSQEDEPKKSISEMYLLNTLQDTAEQEEPERVLQNEEMSEDLAGEDKKLVKEIVKIDERDKREPYAHPLRVERSGDEEMLLLMEATPEAGVPATTTDILVVSKMMEQMSTGENEHVVDELVNDVFGAEDRAVFVESALTVVSGAANTDGQEEEEEEEEEEEGDGLRGKELEMNEDGAITALMEALEVFHEDETLWKVDEEPVEVTGEAGDEHFGECEAALDGMIIPSEEIPLLDISPELAETKEAIEDKLKEQTEEAHKDKTVKINELEKMKMKDGVIEDERNIEEEQEEGEKIKNTKMRRRVRTSNEIEETEVTYANDNDNYEPGERICVKENAEEPKAHFGK